MQYLQLNHIVAPKRPHMWRKKLTLKSKVSVTIKAKSCLLPQEMVLTLEPVIGNVSKKEEQTFFMIPP